MRTVLDYDARRGNGPADLAALSPCRCGDCRISAVPDGIRLAVHASNPVCYSNAQLDDYRALPRRAFPNRPPLALTVRARFSHEAAADRGGPGLLGTAGFGFWNDPFAMSGARWPTLPRALWFFYAGPPSDMKLDIGTPGWGWKAAALDALRPEAIPPALAAPLLIPLMRSPALYRRAWPGIQRRLRIAEALVPGPMTAWRDYRIEWGQTLARFFVDGQPVLDAPAPRGPLGFVIWCDNQYMIVTPQGRFGYGNLPAGPQWLDFSSLRIAPM